MGKFLIVVDMQNDFIDGTLGTMEAQNIVDNVFEKIKKYKDLGREIIFTQDTHYENYLETQEGKNLPVEHCIKNTKGWEICEKLKDFSLNQETKVVSKVTFGSDDLAFYFSELEKTQVIDEIELIGLCTDICVISNAIILKAFLPEVKITVDASCCAGVSPQSHKTALEAMKMCQINVIGE